MIPNYTMEKPYCVKFQVTSVTWLYFIKLSNTLKQFTYAKFSENLAFLTLWYANIRVHDRCWEILVFRDDDFAWGKKVLGISKQLLLILQRLVSTKCSNLRQKSCSICLKVFNVRLTILWTLSLIWLSHEII